MKQLIIAASLLLIATGCRKTDTPGNTPEEPRHQVLVDYVLSNEGMYLVKYKPVYNRYYQVTSLLRGEQFAPEAQLQQVATFFYPDDQPASKPDSVLVYNVRGKVAGVIKENYNQVTALKKDTAYRYPERRNRFLETPGAATLLRIAGKKVDWAGSGHLGGNGSITLMGYLDYLNKASLQDLITGKTDYGNVTGLQFLFTTSGYPVKIDYTDNYNAAYTHLVIGYRQQ